MGEGRTLQVLAVIFSLMAVALSGYASWTARGAATEIAALRAGMGTDAKVGLGGALGDLMRGADAAVRDRPAPRTPGSKVGKGGGGKAGKRDPASRSKVKGGKAKGGKAKGGKRAR